MPNTPWIGVDLDGTLAEWHGDIDSIGAPIEPMIARVCQWLADGKLVKIVTARVACTGEYVDVSSRHDDEKFAKTQKDMIYKWCLEHIGMVLPVTCSKDFAMVELWDDRAVSVVTNKGTIKDQLGFSDYIS